MVAVATTEVIDCTSVVAITVVEGSVEIAETTAVAVCRIIEVLRSYLTSVVSFSCVTKAVAAGLVTVIVVVACPHVDVEVRKHAVDDLV